MTKKSRKKSQPVRLSPTQMVQPGVGEEATASLATALAQPAPETTDLSEEYRYVTADLKRIGLIAVGTVAALVALALLSP